MSDCKMSYSRAACKWGCETHDEFGDEQGCLIGAREEIESLRAELAAWRSGQVTEAMLRKSADGESGGCVNCKHEKEIIERCAQVADSLAGFSILGEAYSYCYRECARKIRALRHAELAQLRGKGYNDYLR